MDRSADDKRNNPWRAVLLVWTFGGILGLVAGRMLPGMDQNRKDPEF